MSEGEPLAPEIAARIEASFARQSLMATMGARLAHVGAGRCRIAATLGPGVLQQHGFAHAGLTFALGDSAAGYAALTQMPVDREVLTVEMKINLLAPGRGPEIVAEGRIVRPGRRLTIVTAEVFSVDGEEATPIALLQGTMIPV